MPHFHDLLREYGYAMLFCVVLVESFGIPAPGQALLIACALLAAHGKLNILGVLAAGFAGGTVGGMIGYGIGQHSGRRLVLRFGRYVRIGRPELHRIEGGFSRYGLWFVLFARFFEVLRQLNGIVAGIVHMHFRRFLLANAAGTLLWVGVWGLGSWRLGRQMQDVEDVSEKAGLLFVALLIAVLLVLLGVYVQRRWRKPERGGRKRTDRRRGSGL